MRRGLISASGEEIDFDRPQAARNRAHHPRLRLSGRDDFTTPTSLARAYVASRHARRKTFVTIEGAGHFAVFTKQDAFLAELRARVLPLIH
jgi:pimeloyl-ACP methyl ester carboxylesterase